MNIKQYRIDEVFEENKSDLDLIHLTANENTLSNVARSMLNLPLGGRYWLENNDDHSHNKTIIQKGDFIYKKTR